jgi:cytokinin dehydrogenase
MSDAGGLARALAELNRQCDCEVRADAETLRGYARNFGGMRECMPQLLVRPRSERDVLAALEVSRHFELPITARGAGHCQADQGLGAGIVLDMTQMHRVIGLNRERGVVDVEAGASWHQLAAATSVFDLLPVGLSHILDTTLGGTLSVGGIGAESFRTGAQVDNIAYLDVATLDGEVRRCSHDREPELFDAVRAGLGQCGIILRVGYAVRPYEKRINVRSLIYRDAQRFLEDVRALADPSAVGRWLACSIAPDPFSPARHTLLLFLGQEHAEGEHASAPVPQLHAEFELRGRQGPLWEPDGRPGHPFFRFFGDETHGDPAASEVLHPWIEHLYPLARAQPPIETLLERREVPLGSGTAAVLIVRRGPHPAPLFVTPAAELSVGVGVFASFGSAQREQAEESARVSAARFGAFEGKRYLSGYLPPTGFGWSEHFGEAWASFCRAKRRHDPGARLNPGILRWPREP